MDIEDAIFDYQLPAVCYSSWVSESDLFYLEFPATTSHADFKCIKDKTIVKMIWDQTSENVELPITFDLVENGWCYMSIFRETKLVRNSLGQEETL